jgi:hypothetical protein
MCEHRDDADTLARIQRIAVRAAIEAERGFKTDAYVDLQRVANDLHMALIKIVLDSSCPLCERRRSAGA